MKIAAFTGTAREFRNYLNLMERKLSAREMETKRLMEERKERQEVKYAEQSLKDYLPEDEGEEKVIKEY